MRIAFTYDLVVIVVERCETDYNGVGRPTIDTLICAPEDAREEVLARIRARTSQYVDKIMITTPQ